VKENLITKITMKCDYGKDAGNNEKVGYNSR